MHVIIMHFPLLCTSFAIDEYISHVQDSNERSHTPFQQWRFFCFDTHHHLPVDIFSLPTPMLAGGTQIVQDGRELGIQVQSFTRKVPASIPRCALAHAPEELMGTGEGGGVIPDRKMIQRRGNTVATKYIRAESQGMTTPWIWIGKRYDLCIFPVMVE